MTATVMKKMKMLIRIMMMVITDSVATIMITHFSHHVSEFPTFLSLTCMSTVASVSRVSTCVRFGRGFGICFPLHVGCTAKAHHRDQEKGPHVGEESDER